MKPINPFLVTGYHSPTYFCDREEETKTLLDGLRNGRNLTLIAPRRVGKTGLIHNLFYQLKKSDPEVVTFYMDIFSTQNRGEFVQLFSSIVLGKLDSAPQRALERIGRFVKSFRPAITFDELTGVPKVTVDIAPSQEESSLKEILDYLQSSEKRCYVAIDEFQQISEYPEKGMEALFRSYIQFIPNVSFIFAGSKQHIMQEMFLSPKRPFYQSTQILSLDSIEKDRYYTFAAAFFEEQGYALDMDLFSHIYGEFEGHTWYIQAILNRLYSYRGTPDSDCVIKAVAAIVAESSYMYEHLLDAYPAGAVRLLKAIAKERCVKEINSGEFIARHNLRAASSVNTALKKLIEKEMVYKTAGGYMIYDRFMAVWLRQLIY